MRGRGMMGRLRLPRGRAIGGEGRHRLRHFRLPVIDAVGVVPHSPLLGGEVEVTVCCRGVASGRAHEIVSP